MLAWQLSRACELPTGSSNGDVTVGLNKTGSTACAWVGGQRLGHKSLNALNGVSSSEQGEKGRPSTGNLAPGRAD